MKVILSFVKPNKRRQNCVFYHEFISVLSTPIIITYCSNSTVLLGVQLRMEFCTRWLHKAIPKRVSKLTTGRWVSLKRVSRDCNKEQQRRMSGQVLSMSVGSLFSSLTLQIWNVMERNTKYTVRGSGLQFYPLYLQACNLGKTASHLWIIDKYVYIIGLLWTY